MTASKTILARKIDDYVLSKEPNSIAAEISEHNGVTVETVQIIPRPHMLKIRVSNLQECHHLLERGIKLFSRVILIYNMSQDTYTETNQCYKCLQFTHKTARCTATTDTCSKCGKNGHNYKNCSSDTLKCCNCGGDHPAVAFKCPRKREAIAAQAQAKQPQHTDTTTYPSAAAPPTITAAPTPALTLSDTRELKEQHSKSYQCLLFAAELAKGDLTDLTKYYTRLATHNGLPRIDIPSDFIQEVKASYQQKFLANQTPDIICQKSKHCRSRSRSHKRPKTTPTTSSTPAPAPLAHSSRPAHSIKLTATPHEDTSLAADVDGPSEDEPSNESSSAGTKPKQIITRNKKESRHNRTNNA